MTNAAKGFETSEFANPFGPLRAFERRGHVVLIQVTAPSRSQVAEYRELKRGA